VHTHWTAFGLVNANHEFAQVYHVDGLAFLGWWSEKDDLAYISIEKPIEGFIAAPRPALLDLSTGEYRLMPNPFGEYEVPFLPYGHAIVTAVQLGPFARVVDTGSCLRVRAEPSLTGAVIDCMADGVLLRDGEETRDSGGATWLRVTTPAGIQGWASTAFLEYTTSGP